MLRRIPLIDLLEESLEGGEKAIWIAGSETVGQEV